MRVKSCSDKRKSTTFAMVVCTVALLSADAIFL